MKSGFFPVYGIKSWIFPEHSRIPKISVFHSLNQKKFRLHNVNWKIPVSISFGNFPGIPLYGKKFPDHSISKMEILFRNNGNPTANTENWSSWGSWRPPEPPPSPNVYVIFLMIPPLSPLSWTPPPLSNLCWAQSRLTVTNRWQTLITVHHLIFGNSCLLNTISSLF